VCQLLGMNCNVPTDICFSFTGFQARGGATDVHTDGWGIAFFEGPGVRLFLDPQPSSASPVAELVRAYPIRSTNVVAHIRKATRGAIGLENTHPFLREAWGRNWIFAHNGHLEGFAPELAGFPQPVGSTDSEAAFCWLLQELLREFGAVRPPDETLFAALARLTIRLAAYGECNFLLSGGEWLMAHASTRLAYIVRRAPFTEAHLRDQDVTVDFSAVTTPADRVAVIATEPLTDNETWEEMPAGSLWWFQEGEAKRWLPTLAGQRRTPPAAP
jgi:glutamine amidotransferase